MDRLGRALTTAVTTYNQTVGSLESRVLVTARRLNDLGVVDGDLEPPVPVEETARALSAPELTGGDPAEIRRGRERPAGGPGARGSMTQTRAQTPTREATSDRKTVPRLEPRASVRLTGRGALAALFVLCFFTQLIADWTGWGTLAGAAFVCGCGAVTYYTRPAACARWWWPRRCCSSPDRPARS